MRQKLFLRYVLLPRTAKVLDASWGLSSRNVSRARRDVPGIVLCGRITGPGKVSSEGQIRQVLVGVPPAFRPGQDLDIVPPLLQLVLPVVIVMRP